MKTLYIWPHLPDNYTITGHSVSFKGLFLHYKISRQFVTCLEEWGNQHFLPESELSFRSVGKNLKGLACIYWIKGEGRTGHDTTHGKCGKLITAVVILQYLWDYNKYRRGNISNGTYLAIEGSGFLVWGFYLLRGRVIFYS